MSSNYNESVQIQNKNTWSTCLKLKLSIRHTLLFKYGYYFNYCPQPISRQGIKLRALQVIFGASKRWSNLASQVVAKILQKKSKLVQVNSWSYLNLLTRCSAAPGFGAADAATPPAHWGAPGGPRPGAAAGARHRARSAATATAARAGSRIWPREWRQHISHNDLPSPASVEFFGWKKS